MKTNKVTITGFAIGIIVLVLNIIIDIIVLNMALIVSTGITEQSSNIELYRWEGVGEPQIPTIDKNTGEITDWKEQKGTK
ncbi:hypothetical protein M1771_07605 [Spiroplasma citri]|nr:hypothetical protein [Spiroplasma citri]WFG99858.1 hypothetical protein M1771_07605 [Spiroplasma citri]